MGEEGREQPEPHPSALGAPGGWARLYSVVSPTQSHVWKRVIAGCVWLQREDEYVWSCCRCFVSPEKSKPPEGLSGGVNPVHRMLLGVLAVYLAAHRWRKDNPKVSETCCSIWENRQAFFNEGKRRKECLSYLWIVLTSKLNSGFVSASVFFLSLKSFSEDWGQQRSAHISLA